MNTHSVPKQAGPKPQASLPRIDARVAPVQATPKAAPPVSLHIDRLVLQGFAFLPRDGVRMQQAFQAEVSRLIEDGELKAEQLSAQALSRLRLGELRLQRGGGPEQLGVALAAALLKELAS